MSYVEMPSANVARADLVNQVEPAARLKLQGVAAVSYKEEITKPWESDGPSSHFPAKNSPSLAYEVSQVSTGCL